MDRSSGFKTGCTAKIRGCALKGSMARKTTVCPPIERYCFGPPEPARRPRPAATRMAAVRSAFDIGHFIKGSKIAPNSPYHGCNGESTAIPVNWPEKYDFVAAHLQLWENCLKCRQ